MTRELSPSLLHQGGWCCAGSALAGGVKTADSSVPHFAQRRHERPANNSADSPYRTMDLLTVQAAVFEIWVLRRCCPLSLMVCRIAATTQPNDGK